MSHALQLFTHKYGMSMSHQALMMLKKIDFFSAISCERGDPTLALFKSTRGGRLEITDLWVVYRPNEHLDDPSIQVHVKDIVENVIMYTGISHTSDTIGNGNPEKSSLYFAGNLTRDRLQNLHYKRSGKKEMYQNIQLLKIWSTYLSKNIIKNDFNDLEKIELKKWSEETQIKYEDLLETILFHKHHEWKTC